MVPLAVILWTTSEPVTLADIPDVVSVIGSAWDGEYWGLVQFTSPVKISPIMLKKPPIPDLVPPTSREPSTDTWSPARTEME